MAGDTQPVVIPVIADASTIPQAARDAAEELRRARDVPGGGAAPAGTSSGEAASVRTVVRELLSLERNLRSLNQTIDDLLRNAARGGSGAAQPGQTPLTTPGGAPVAPGSAPAPGTPPPPGPRGAPQVPMSNLMRSMLYGGAGALGVGIGFGAMFGEAGRFISSSRKFEEQAWLAGMAGGGDPGVGVGMGPDSTQVGSDILGYQGTTSPHARVQLAAQLRRQGINVSGRDASRLAEIGQQTMGSPGAAGQVAQTMFDTLRSDRAIELLTALARHSAESGVGMRELVTQFEGLARLTAARGGAAARDPEKIAQLMATLGALPRGTGRGAAGVQLTQSLAGGIRGGMGQTMFLSAYMAENPDRDPMGDPEDYVDFMRAQADPSRFLPMMQKGFGPGGSAYGGRDKGPGWQALRTIFMTEAGLPIESAAGFAEGVGMTPIPNLDLPDAETAGGIVDDMASAAGDFAGGASLLADALLEASKAAQTSLANLATYLDQFKASIGAPASAGLSGAAGLALGYGLPVGVGAYLGTRGARMAGMGSMRTGMGMLSRAAPWAMAGYGLYGAADDTGLIGDDGPDYGGIIAGGVGGALGLGLSAFTGGTMSPLMAMAGYGAGRGIYKMLSGSNAHAATGPDGQPIVDPRLLPGWQRDEVREHLDLLRLLVSQGRLGNDTALQAYLTGGYRPPSAGMMDTHPSWGEPIRAETDFSAEWDIGADGKPSGPIRRPPRGLPRRGAAMTMPGSETLGYLDPRIAEAAAREGIPLATFLALIHQESTFQTGVVSSAGAKGLTQLMDPTARAHGVSRRNTFDVGENLRGGAEHLREVFEEARAQGLSGEEAQQRALAGYNAGMRGSRNTWRNSKYAREVREKIALYEQDEAVRQLEHATLEGMGVEGMRAGQRFPTQEAPTITVKIELAEGADEVLAQPKVESDGPIEVVQ